jgi:hypothetical protein
VPAALSFFEPQARNRLGWPFHITGIPERDGVEELSLHILKRSPSEHSDWNNIRQVTLT